MKHLIKDVELVSYLEGNLTKEEIILLKKRLKDNGELDMLYHLQFSWNKGMEEYANTLIGEDDFMVDTKSMRIFTSEIHRMAADKDFPKKND